MTDAWPYAVWPDPRSRSRVIETPLKRSRPSVLRGAKFLIVSTSEIVTFYDVDSIGLGNHVLRGDSDPPMWRFNFEVEIGRTIAKYKNTLPRALQKRLNRPRCRLGCGLRWAQGSMLDGGKLWRHLANTTEMSVCGGDEPYGKLLWPLVVTNYWSPYSMEMMSRVQIWCR